MKQAIHPLPLGQAIASEDGNALASNRMKTIDDLKFPAMDKPATQVVLKSNLLLPNGFVIVSGKQVELSHNGIHAIVKVGEEEYRF